MRLIEFFDLNFLSEQHWIAQPEEFLASSSTFFAMVILVLQKPFDLTTILQIEVQMASIYFHTGSDFFEQAKLAAFLQPKANQGGSKVHLKLFDHLFLIHSSPHQQADSGVLPREELKLGYERYFLGCFVLKDSRKCLKLDLNFDHSLPLHSLRSVKVALLHLNHQAATSLMVQFLS